MCEFRLAYDPQPLPAPILPMAPPPAQPTVPAWQETWRFHMPQQECAIQRYFRDHPNERMVMMACFCPSCSPRC